VQILVYIFIALAALAVGAATYFGLTFTPVEAILASIVFAGIGILVQERLLRVRAETRLEKAIEELSRLLSTDAQAGAVLSRRVNQLAEENSGQRLEIVEADISVLGTVIRQVAEAVAEIEGEQRNPGGARPVHAEPAAADDWDPELAIPLETVRQALAANRLIHHVQPIVTLPQRRTHGHDLVARLRLEGGGLAEPEDFLPRQGGEDILCQVDASALTEAITLGRRARSNGHPVNLFIPLSRATLLDRASAEQHLASIQANNAIAQSLTFVMSEAEWQALDAPELTLAEHIVKAGAAFSLTGVKSLRGDVGALAAQGVRSLRVDGGTLLTDPEHFTDFHLSDIASYLARFGVDLIATGITDERQILELLEDEITLVQGPHIGGPAPAKADLISERSKSPAALRRVEG
jgi:cyclic-di-GMP phosphodiesterase TipF (flagellum assembly factor)